MMKDSKIPWAWVQEQMRANPPQVLANGNILSGPVRLSFPNLFQPGKPGPQEPAGAQGKYGATLLFPPGTDMAVFKKAWTDLIKQRFPEHVTPTGEVVGIKSPFHDQAEKAYGAKPLAGYTPGAVTFTASSNYKPPVVNGTLALITDESRVYPGVWAIVAVNLYPYSNVTKGVSFGLQTVMLIADDQKLGGGGSDPKTDFAAVKITAQSNIAAQFERAPVAGTGAPAASVMPAGGHVGTPGTLPVEPLGAEWS